MLNCQRDLFQLDESVTFINCAYLSPQLKSVEAAGRHVMSHKNTPNLLQPGHFFDQVQNVKREFAKVVNAAEPERIAILSSVSYGVATVARNLPIEAGQEILIAKDQFPSNYYSWARLADEKGARLRVIEVADGPDKGLRWNAAILDAIGPQTALVAISHVHWAEGLLFDLVAMRVKTTAHNAWLVVDGTQSVGALPFDVQEIQPDALICAAYKWLMGPYSTALAYYGPALDDGIPIEENWINRKNSQDFRGLVNYESDYQPLAGRYCIGQHSNFLLMPMLETALQQINAWQPARIQAYCEQLNAPYLAKLEEMGFGILPAEQRSHHLVGIRLPAGVAMEELQAVLAERRIMVSVRGQSIRIAPNVYNHSGDWDKLLKVLEEVCSLKTA